ncbi:MAG TPA: APC family permease [Mycobacteriales bacterium]|jgi:amino acid transporter|nr:APC family permease [Mycobacteriales bacterium]
MTTSAATVEPTGDDTAGTQLAKGSLRTLDAVAISISVLSPGMAMALNTGGVAGTAGGSTPLATLLGGVGCLALAFVVIGFTRRMAAAGYAYTYVSRSAGKSAGFLSGWLYFGGFACFVPMTMAGVGWLTCDLLDLDPKWWFAFFLAGMALLVVLSVVRISVTTKVQLLIGAFTILVLLALDLVITGKGGVHGQSAGAFTFSHTASNGFHGVFYGLILGVTSYIGFESAADFGEETANPRRAVPIAVFAAVIFAIVLYVFTTYAVTIGYGVPELAKDPSAWVSGGIIPAADHYGDQLLGKLVEIGALLSAFVVCVACATAGARTLFAMGREGVLPRWFSHTHPRYKTPVNGTLTIAGVATIFAVIVGYGFGTPTLGGNAFTVYYFFATIGTLAVVLVYIALCLGGIAYFQRTTGSKFNPLTHGLIPLIGAIIFGAAWYGSVYPVPPSILKATPYLTAGWLVVGIGVLLWLRANRPDSVARVGSILGEEGGELVEALDSPA